MRPSKPRWKISNVPRIPNPGSRHHLDADRTDFVQKSGNQVDGAGAEAFKHNTAANFELNGHVATVVREATVRETAVWGPAPPPDSQQRAAKPIEGASLAMPPAPTAQAFWAVVRDLSRAAVFLRQIASRMASAKE
jgi:hypothetical protein